MKLELKKFLFVFLIGASLVLQSCNNNVLYDKSHSFKNTTWTKGDTAIFKVEVQDTISKYDFILSLRTTKEYLYSDLWTYIFITAPDGTTSKVAQKIPLAHPDGSWTGRVSGTLVESSLRFDSRNFPLKGEYIFKLSNATQEEEIPFVEDIGLRIERHRNE